MTESDYREMLKDIKGKTIAIVYIFERETAKGFKHYDIWKSDVIMAWLKAVQELECVPYILDVKTFLYKASNNTLPFINYVINLNAGNYDLSVAGLVPSICSFLSIPCIPCNTVSTIVGEHKFYSNCIAQNVGINVPKEVNLNDKSNDYIIKPIGFGSSFGIEKNKENNSSDFIKQEFIKGFDVSTPMLYNPLSEQIETLPAIMYLPDNNDINWFLNANAKEKHKGYSKRNIKLNDDVSQKYCDLAQKFDISTFCRIDCRIKCNEPSQVTEIVQRGIRTDEAYFLEINPTPTIRENINFLNSFNYITKISPFFRSFDIYKNYVRNASSVGFILSSSIISIIKAKHCE